MVAPRDEPCLSAFAKHVRNAANSLPGRIGRVEDLCKAFARDGADSNMWQQQVLSSSRMQYSPKAFIAELNKTTYHDAPPLAYAVQVRNTVAVRTLLEAGANPQGTIKLPLTSEDGWPLIVPVLALAVLTSEARIVQLLLAFGAVPYDVPSLLWADATHESAASMMGEWCHCSSFMALLKASITYPMQYFLREATKLPQLTATERGALQATLLTSLPAVRLLLVGQQAATKIVYSAVTKHRMDKAKKPLAMVFAGPPGHGKTHLAEELRELFDAPHIVINCTKVQGPQDLFGYADMYQGSEKSTPFIKFLKENSGKPCVVILDEFEKVAGVGANSKKGVFHGFLPIFEKGQGFDHHDNSTIDCTQAIFVLNTNALDDVIEDYMEEHPDIRHVRQMKASALAKRLRALQSAMKKRADTVFGKPLTSRISHLVPFFPFTTYEASVITAEGLRELQTDLRKPPNTQNNRLYGDLHVTIKDEEELCMKLAEDLYEPSSGARQLRNNVAEQALEEILMLWREEKLREGSRLAIRLEDDWFAVDLACM